MCVCVLSVCECMCLRVSENVNRGIFLYDMCQPYVFIILKNYLTSDLKDTKTFKACINNFKYFKLHFYDERVPCSRFSRWKKQLTEER